MSTSVMYSQQEEETYILKHTPATGRFCDIGAYHAKDLSNTRALYERGWGGVLVEPSPGPCRELLREYGSDSLYGTGRVVIVQALVGIQHDLKCFHVAADTPYSTAHEDRFRNGPHPLTGDLFVPQLTPQDLIDHWGPFDFVNIDVEGGSVDILRELMGTTAAYFPKCICVEHDGRIPEAIKITQQLYYLAYDNSTNLIFVKK